MPSDFGDSRPAFVEDPMGPRPQPKLVDPLPCPRCNSTNTKFCYYNNYNLSQPRHFCKACRRYWTHGGTLRNVPVGGGTRKNSKCSRSSSSSTSSTNTSASTLSTLTHESESLPATTHTESALHFLKSENSDNLNLNENLNYSVPASENENFISLLNSQQGAGLMGMVGYGPGFGYGLCEFGIGFGGMGYFNDGGTEGGSGLVDGGDQCFSCPGLAISTTGKGLK